MTALEAKKTLRERARAAAQALVGAQDYSFGGWRLSDELESAADAASDVWEPVVTELTSALERLVALGPHGHKYSPVDARGAEVIRLANDSGQTGTRLQSLRCWDCRLEDDLPRGVESDATWADLRHEGWDAWSVARRLLERFGG